MKYKKTAKSLKEIANELDAGVILEGSVRKAGNKIRVTVQMINAITDSHVWRENFNREFDDIFEIQSGIPQAVASTTKSHLLVRNKKEIARGSTSNPEAHSAYLLGKYLVNEGSKDDHLKGIELLKRSIGLDPSFAEAYAALSVCYSYMAGQYISDDEGFPLAKEYGQKAVQLDEENSDAHVSLGLVALQYDWDWEKARSELLRAIELNPSNSSAHLWYGFYLGMNVRAEEGVRELEKAEELDPLSHIVKLNVGCL
jgi:adenylate cyclase